jgi:hypothetical protein
MLALVRQPGTGARRFRVGPFVHLLLAEYRQVAIVWDTGDVTSVRPDLTDRQAWEVLKLAGQNHDATEGINWDVLDAHAEFLYGGADETDDAEEQP